MPEVMRSLTDFFKPFFKKIQTQFSPTLKIKAIMDSTHRNYLLLEGDIALSCDTKIFSDIYHFFGGYESVLEEEKIDAVCFFIERESLHNKHLLRNIFRQSFKWEIYRRVIDHFSGSTYQQRVKFDLFIEEYTEVLFPPLPPVDKSSNYCPGKDTKGGNDAVYDRIRHILNNAKRDYYKSIWPLSDEINITTEKEVKESKTDIQKEFK